MMGWRDDCDSGTTVGKTNPDPARVAVNARGVDKILSSHLTKTNTGRLTVYATAPLGRIHRLPPVRMVNVISTKAK